MTPNAGVAIATGVLQTALPLATKEREQPSEHSAEDKSFTQGCVCVI